MAALAVGLVAAKAAGGVLARHLYDVAPTYASGALALLLVSGLAAVVPTLRATRVNPAVTMRSD